MPVSAAETIAGRRSVAVDALDLVEQAAVLMMGMTIGGLAGC